MAAKRATAARGQHSCMLGREAGVRTRMFMLALVLGSSARIVQAQAHAPALPPLHYEAPAACPDRNYFEERMRARLRADGVTALTSLSLEVKIEASRRTVRGVVEIVRDSTRGARNLEGDSCREVVEGLALIAALAVTAPAEAAKARPASADISAAPPPRGDVASRGRSPKAAARPRAPPPTAAAAATLETAPSEAAAPAPRAASQSSPSATPRAAQPVADSGSPASEAADSRDHEARLRGFSVGAAVLVLHGLAPRIQPGLQLEAALTLAEGPLDWTLRAGGRLALEASVQSSQGRARFGFAAGVVQLCATGALGPNELTLAGCAVAEPGFLLASGDNTRDSRSYTRPWLAAGAGLGLGWRAASWLALRLGAELLVPARRDRMLLAGDVVHDIPPACLRLELGAEVPLG